MEFLSSLISTLFYIPVFNLLIVFYKYLGSLGMAIVAVAFVHKVVTYSITKNQIKSAEKNQLMQARMNKIKNKYKANKDLQTKELAKVQAEYMPGMIGGCLNVIISLVLLIQLRNVVVNIVNQGVHAFNKVAYVESLKYKEDKIEINLPEGFSYGEHEINYKIETKEGGKLDKTLKFALVENKDQKKEKSKIIQDYYKNLSTETKNNERNVNIGIYVDEFKTNYIVEGTLGSTLTTYLRPPLNDKINYEKVFVNLDGKEITGDDLKTSEGESLNLEFLGADLSRVASDFNYSNIIQVSPYVLIAVSVGVTQFFASKIQMGMNPKPAKKKKVIDPKKKKEEEEMPDFSEQMAQTSQRMIYFFPVMTIFMSLGYMGGANIFPLGVSLFWTAQNLFVIIQQVVMNRKKVSKYLREKSTLIINKLNKNGKRQNN